MAVGRLGVVDGVLVGGLDQGGERQRGRPEGRQSVPLPPEVEEETDRQQQRQLQPAEQGQGAEERQQRWHVDRRERFRDGEVVAVREAGRHRHAEGDVKRRQEPRKKRVAPHLWQRLQKTVARPPIRTSVSGRPQLKQGLPPRP